MIKVVLSVKENIETNKFARVIAFLKRNSVGYEPKKSKVLTREEIKTFLTNANIVQKDEECLIVTIPDTTFQHFQW